MCASQNSLRIDCACHLVQALVELSWRKCLLLKDEMKILDESVRSVLRLAKQSKELHKELPPNLKGTKTGWPWRQLHEMFAWTATNSDVLRENLNDKAEERLLNAIDFDLLQEVVRFLDPIDYVLDMLEFSGKPTLQNVLRGFDCLQKKWTVSSDDSDNLRCMKKMFSETLEGTVWPRLSPFHMAAALLDPTLRTLSMVGDEGRQEICKRQAIDLISSLATTSQQAFVKQPTLKKRKNEEDISPHFGSSVREKVMEEWEIYNAMPAPSDPFFDLMSFWEEREEDLPSLSRAARSVLVVPAAVAESERYFAEFNARSILRPRGPQMEPQAADVIGASLEFYKIMA